MQTVVRAMGSRRWRWLGACMAVCLCACSSDSDETGMEDGSSPGLNVPGPANAGTPPAPPAAGTPTTPETPTTPGTPSAETATPGAVPTQPEGGTGGSDTPTAGDGDAEVECATEAEQRFSFFMVSYEAIRRESGSDQGFGGNLGGIEGADGICRRVALTSSDCAGNRTWRAFLSTTTEDAIDRIGSGPWHDRLGRLLANDVQELLNERPPNADREIIDDFPNEFGVPNHNPDGTGEVDNHQTLTGTGTDGRLYTQAPDSGMMGGGFPGGFGGSTACMDGEWTPEKATCWDWTVDDALGCPRVGHSWPRQGSGLHWISVWNEGGCAPGVVLDDFQPAGAPTVGSFGGYGGFYCFAADP